MEKKTQKVKLTNDIISDTLTRIRNAIRANKSTVLVPNTRMVLEILNVLTKYGFLGGYNSTEFNAIEVNLLVNGKYAITDLKRISKPGVRKYVRCKDIRLVKGGYGIAVISTSRGVMSNIKARKLGVGGEYICEVW